MKKIIDYLEKLDFSKNEATVYLTLLKSGPMTVQEIAKATDTNRTALYTYITSLSEKGVIVETMKASHKQFVAVTPERLHYLIDNKQEALQMIKNQFPAMVQTINTSISTPQQEEKADIKYYKGRTGLHGIYMEAFQTNELRVYANLTQSANNYHPSDMDFDIFERALAQNKKLRIFEIIGDSPESVEQYNLEGTAKSGRYFYKFMPADIGLDSATLMYANRVAILNIKQEISGIVLTNTDYYNNSKKQFDFIWKLLPEPKK